MTNDEKPRLNQKTFFQYCQGREVDIAFMDGTTMRAVQVDVDRYSIFVKSDNRVILVMKHSIKTMQPISGDKEVTG